MSGNLWASPDGKALYLEDHELEALGLDPWSRRGWAGEDLRAFASELRSRVEAIRRETERTFLSKHRKASVEPWMVPALERELGDDRAYVARMRVLPLFEDAVHRGARVVFDID